jgi:Flp pilus assembly protein TadD
MSKPFRFGPAISAAVLAFLVPGCAAPQKVTGWEGKPQGDVGLATRALAAMNSNNLPQAIDLAERAVQKSPDDAGFRTLLGNAYFAAGRFRSAESAYKDSLSLYSNQPQVVLKLALVQIALGKNDDALNFLQAGHSVIDASDYGLALALAGRPSDAIPVLEAAARETGADARVRQNLALAYALSGDWTEARTIAAQDVPANQLDARIQQWMQFAKPAKASDQVAALVGVKPAADDQGEPVRLALRKNDTMVAEAAPAAAPQPSRPAQPQLAEAPATPAPAVEAAAAPVEMAPPALPLAPVTVPTPAPKPVIADATVSTAGALLATAAREVSSVVQAFVPHKAAAKSKARVAAVAPHRGASNAVMQIGSYRSPQQVSAGWARLTQRFPALRAYLPMRARFDSANGTYWRLSIQGFDSQREAIARCDQLKSHGGQCFVRRYAGDKPVEIASR